MKRSLEEGGERRGEVGKDDKERNSYTTKIHKSQ